MENIMLELQHNGFYPLTEEHLNMHVPSQPGIYLLAVRLANGVHRTFYTSQSDNLYKSLRNIVSPGDDALQSSETVREYLSRYRCYFSYWVIVNVIQRNEVCKMLSQTNDPTVRLRVVNCN